MTQNSLKDQTEFAAATTEEVKGIDLKAIIAGILRYWYLFLIGTILCLLLAVLYAYHSPEMWKITGKILVEDEKSSQDKSLNSGMNKDLGSLLSMKSNADNEVDILKSRSLMKRIVSLLDLNVRIYSTEAFKSVEVYEDAPFRVNIHYKNSSFKTQVYRVIISDSEHVRIINTKLGIDRIIAFGKLLDLTEYSLTFSKTLEFKPQGEYKVIVETITSATQTFLASYSASLSSKEATTINLTLNYPNSRKGEVILNKLMELYLQNNLENKSKIADSTMKFIDDRLAIVGTELGNVEKQLENYKERNNITNISEQSKSLVEGASDYYNKLNDIDVQLAVINDLNNYLNKPGNHNVVPSSLTTKDPAFGAAINNYNQLLLERDKQKLSYSEANPVVRNLSQQIESGRQNLMHSLESYRQGLKISKAELSKQNVVFSGKIRQVPGKERIFLDYSRQQSLKQELYLFLLQKREETAIAKTSTISSTRIVDPAESDDLPFAPKKPVIYLIGLIAGLGLPITYLWLKKLLNSKVNNKADIEKKIQVQIVGEIGHNTSSEVLVVDNKGTQSLISEQFRNFRTNLQYILDTKKSNVILFTSSTIGEGKLFLSYNLGNALAMTGKKVVLMELNLRKPMLSERMGLNNDNGFTNYIMDDSVTINSILKPARNLENLFLVSSGPVPPNPAELLASERLESLINELKIRFDFVIIIAPPIDIVSDALLIEKYADVTFYTVRQKYTSKSQLDIVNDLQRTGKIKNLYIVINDIENRKKDYSDFGTYINSYNKYNRKKGRLIQEDVIS